MALSLEPVRLPLADDVWLGETISEILAMTVDEMVEYFSAHQLEDSRIRP